MSSREDKILIGVSRLRNLLHREMEKHFREHGLTSAQFSVLEALYSKGDLNVGEIQEAILGTPGNVPLIINNLVKAGYAARRVGEKDRRVSVIHLTEAGRERMERIFPEQHQLWLEQLLSGVSDEEKDSLIQKLQQTFLTVQKNSEQG